MMRFVGLAVHGRRRDAQFPGISEAAREFGWGCAGADPKCESRFHGDLAVR